MKLEDKVALVTGGTRGIGKAIVLDFIKEGAKIAFFYKESTMLANKLVKEIKNKGREILALKTDVSDFDNTIDSVNKIVNIFGKIDIVVNNAGILGSNTIMTMTKQDWDRIINTNLTGVFNVTKASVLFLIKQKSGAIINISSIVTSRPLIGQSHYISSKAGIIGFTRAIAMEVARYGITVNAISPGFIETDMSNSVPHKIKEDTVRLIPLGRVGNPEEVAKLVTFLACDNARYITGQVITIDGGLSLV